MDLKIIDFHIHPFTNNRNNICKHTDYCDLTTSNTVRDMKKWNVTNICGSVITTTKGYDDIWENLKVSNQTALELKGIYRDFYIPGFHVHPGYVRESCDEIEKMSKQGVHLIGELVPYHDGWDDYSCKAFDEILDVAKQYNMVVSFHTMNNDSIDRMVDKHPDVVLVAAHPGEYDNFTRHLERMKKSENYYLDISGTGILRYGVLKHGIDLFGAERFIYGSDFPICNPAAYIGGILFDSLISDKQKEFIFYKNAQRLLNISNYS